MKTRACKEDAATVTQHHAPETATEGPHIRQLKSDSREPEWCRRGAVRVVCYFSWKCLPAFLHALPATSWPPYASFHRSSRHVAAQSPEFLLADATCQNLLASALQHSRHHGAYSAPGMEEAKSGWTLGDLRRRLRWARGVPSQMCGLQRADWRILGRLGKNSQKQFRTSSRLGRCLPTLASRRSVSSFDLCQVHVGEVAGRQSYRALASWPCLPPEAKVESRISLPIVAHRQSPGKPTSTRGGAGCALMVGQV